MNGCLHLDTFSLVYDAEPAVPDCEFSIVLSDSGGDGWNETIVLVGEVVLDDITIASEVVLHIVLEDKMVMQ